MGMCANCRNRGCVHSRANLGSCSMYWPKPVEVVSVLEHRKLRKKKGGKKKRKPGDRLDRTTGRVTGSRDRPSPSAVVDFIAGKD